MAGIRNKNRRLDFMLTQMEKEKLTKRDLIILSDYYGEGQI